MLINSNKFMKLENYKKVRLVIVFILAMVISQLILLQNYIIPIMVMIVTTLILFYLKEQVTEVIADERDYAIGGQSALMAIQVFSWLAAILMFVLYAKKNVNPAYEQLAFLLSYSICFLMIIYSLIFRFYNKIKGLKKSVYLGLFLLITFIIVGVSFIIL